MYRADLLILAIVLLILGIGLPYIPMFPDVIGVVLFWAGFIVFVVWLVIYILKAIGREPI
jgi:hypothetical protein